MKKHWLALILFCAGSAHAQFVKNTGITLLNSANVTVNGDWDNQGANFTNNGRITTSENWTSTGGYSQSGTGGFVLTNTTTRQFSHGGQYVGFLTKNGAGNTQVDNHLIVSGNLLLQNGLLTMTGVNDTIVTLPNAVVSGTPTSFVVGKVSRYGNGDLVFPVSAGGYYLPITIYQVTGTNPRVTISMQNAPAGYTINGTGNSLISFPYAWKSSVVRGDTATYVEVQYPTSLPTSVNPIIARSVDATHYGSMGLQTVTTGGGVTKIKSYARGLRGLFTVAQGVLLALDAPQATSATFTTPVGFTANWAAVINATGYQLDVSIDNFSSLVTGFNNLTVTTGTSAAVTGLTPATAYQYRVRAAGTSPTSVNSNVITVSTLSVPAPIAAPATSININGFTANWSAVTSATGYQLDVSADNFVTFAAGFNNSLQTGTSSAVSGLTPGTVYKYRVRATSATSTSTNSNVIDVTTSPKVGQTITFTAITDKVLGDPVFALTATTSSGLGVSYTSTSDKITLSGSQITLVKAGRATITASQPGNGSFNAATSVDQSFCIKPAKPTVTLAGVNTESLTLTSSASAGNQWYLNGAVIAGAINNILSVTGPGIYKVQAKVDDCVSEFSADVPIIITGDLQNATAKIEAYPNPVETYLEVRGLKGEVGGSQLIDMTGRSSSLVLEKRDEIYRANVQSLSDGIYVLRIQEGSAVHQIKFIKK